MTHAKFRATLVRLTAGLLTATAVCSGPASVLAQAPPGTTGIAPVDLVTTPRPSFSWNAVAEATDYQLLINGPGGTPVHQAWYTAAAVCSGGTCTVTMTSSLANGAHDWSVQTRSGVEDGPWSSALLFTVSSYGSIAAGEGHSAAATREGSAWSWGDNARGQLGDGTTTPSSTAIQAAGLSDLARVYAGGDFSAALGRDGRIWTWGANTFGQLGDGTTVDRQTPAVVAGLTDVKALAVGKNHVLALKADGSVVAWGANARGQLGDGTTTDRTTPTAVPALSDIVAIGAGEAHSLALKSGGAVCAWGANDAGQVGDDGGLDQASPVVLSLANIGSIGSGATANHSFAVTSNGGVWAWGRNDSGQLGDGSVTDRFAPVALGTIADVANVSTGGAHSLAVKNDGSVWAWGSDEAGQLGDGASVGPQLEPVAVSGLSNVVSVAAGTAHSLALGADGSVWAWGANDAGQLGDGTTVGRTNPYAAGGSGFAWKSPSPVLGVPGGTYSSEQSVVVTVSHPSATLRYTTNGAEPTETDPAITSGGSVTVDVPLTLKVRAWLSGYAPSDVVSASYALQAAAPVFAPPPGSYVTAQAVTLGTATPGAAIRYTTDGTEPTETSALYAAPLDVSTTTTVRAKAFRASWTASPTVDSAYVVQLASITAGNNHSLAVLPGGVLWAWGYNLNRRLGDGSQTNRLSPVQTSGIGSVASVDAGFDHTLAVKTDGTVWAWGVNANGRLGDGTTTQRLTPVQVVGVTGGVAASAGGMHSLALTSGGAVYAWGYNLYGQLGDGTTTQRLTAVSVSGLATATAISAGRDHSLAMKSDGTVWAWGRNHNGQLGDGTTSNRSTPVQVSGLTGVVAIAAGDYHSLALKSDGTVWAWGNNGNGRLGDGTTTQRNSPVHVVGLTGVVAIDAGGLHSLAARSDGSAWGWGYNANGQLGDGTSTHRTTPVQVLEVADVVAVSAGGFHSLALASDGRVWGWGANTNGQVGDGTTTKRETPMQIGTDFVWSVATPVFSVAAGTYTAEQTVTVTVTTPGATIHYTTNGNDPTETDAVVASGGTVSVTSSLTLKARAFKTGLAPSTVATAGYNLKVALPALSAGTGTYNTTLSVVVTESVPGAALHYSVDGSEPTPGHPSIASGGAVQVDQTLVLKVKGWKSGWLDSDTQSASYTMKVGTPSFSPGEGIYASAQSVTVSTVTSSATLRYTTNGAEPTTQDPVVASGGTLSVGRSQTLKVKGYRSGWTQSDTGTANYGLNLGPAPAPSFDPPGGSYSAAQSVTLRAPVAGGEIRFTTNGSEPGPTSPAYTGAIALTSTTTLKAKTYAPEHTPSGTSSASYDLSAVTGAAPLLAPGAGTYTSRVLVTVTSDVPGSTIHYTTTGVDPTTSDPVVVSGASVLVDRTFVLKARAFVSGAPASAVARADYYLKGFVAAGLNHGLAVATDGSVRSWGLNQYGQLGDGTTQSRNAPVTVAGLADVVGVSGGQSHSLALLPDGTLRSWGLNNLGQLGDGTTTQRTAPVSVASLTGVVSVAAGGHFSLAVRSDGTVWSWGSNYYGQLGDGTTTNRTSPVPVSGLTGVVAVAAGSYHSLALKSDGSVWAWGENTGGQLGDGTTTQRTTPVQVQGLTGVTRIAAGGWTSLALQANGGLSGTLWAWGKNGYGQVGDGTATNRSRPVATLDDVTAMAAGKYHVLAVRAPGSLWSWGYNVSGQLGDGTTALRSRPARVVGPESGVSVAAGDSHSLMLDAAGTVWAFGSNGNGQLGGGWAFTTTLKVPAAATSLVVGGTAGLDDDADGDGLTTAEEYALGTDPDNADTNGDGVADGLAVRLGIDPGRHDTDGDGLGNADEGVHGTSPFDPDTDKDGVLDGLDCAPLDPGRSSCPVNPSDQTPPVVTLLEPAHAVVIP